MREGVGNLIQDKTSNEDVLKKSRNMVEEDSDGQPVRRELDLNALIVCLCVAGCYICQQRKHLVIEVFMIVYKIIVVTAVLFWCIAMTIANSQSVPTFIIVFMITVEGVCNWIICWKTFSKAFGNFQATINKINDLLAELHVNGIVVDKKYINKRQISYLIFAVFLILSDVILQIVIAFVIVPNPGEPEAGKENTTSLYVHPLAESYFTRALMIVPIFFQSFSLVVPPFYLTIINTVLLAILNALNSKLDEYIRIKEGILYNVEIMRRFHVKTCEIIAHLDRDLRYFYGSIFFWTLCQGILVLYLLVKSGRSLVELAILLNLMGLTFVVLIVVAISAVLVHEAVSYSFFAHYS